METLSKIRGNERLVEEFPSLIWRKNHIIPCQLRVRGKETRMFATHLLDIRQEY